MQHELKCDPASFEAIWEGDKHFEIRLDDRNYGYGDVLYLRETKHTGEEMKAGKPLEYTGRTQRVEVVHLLHGPAYGLKEGWVCMSIEEI